MSGQAVKTPLRKIVSQAQAKRLVELAGQGKIKGRDGMSGASVVAGMLNRSAPIQTLPKRIHPVD